MTTTDTLSIAPDTIRHLQSIQVTLTRRKSFPGCTLGTLRIQTRNLVWQCKTLELPWLNNKPQISCIPPGTYRCVRHTSEKFGKVFRLLNVPGREGILFHAGNTARDTHGCILLGVDVETGGRKPCLLSSRAAMKTFMQKLEGVETFELEILDKQ